MRAPSQAPQLLPAKPCAEPRTIRVERFRDVHFEQLYAIETDSFGPDSYNRAFFERLCDDNRNLLFVAIHRGKVVGYVMGEQRARNAEVVSLAVALEYRGVGLGKRLLRRLLKCFREGDAGAVYLMVRSDNPVAATLYRSCRFQVIRRVPGYYMDGSPALRMKRSPL